MDYVDVDAVPKPTDGPLDLLKEKQMYLWAAIMIVTIITIVYLYFTFKPAIKTKEINNQNTVLKNDLHAEVERLRSENTNLLEDNRSMYNKLQQLMTAEPPPAPKAKLKTSDLQKAFTDNLVKPEAAE